MKQQSQKKSHQSKTARDRLREKCPDHPGFEDDVVYSLPLPFIDAMERRAAKLLTQEDLEFERALTEMTGDGLFMEHPFSAPILFDSRSTGSGSDAEFLKPIEQQKAKIKGLFAELMRDNGKSEGQIDRYFVNEIQFRERFRDRRRGYAGWLVTQPQFHVSRCEFLEKWQKTIEQEGQLPSVPKPKMIENNPVVPPERRNYFAAYMQLFRKWSLERMATWHFPLPLHPDMPATKWYDETHLGGAGLSLFIPNYLLAEKDLKLREIIDFDISFGECRHLDGWITGGDSGRDGWSFLRYASLLDMYVYLEKGVFHRYRKKLRGNKERVMEAFIEYQEGRKLAEITIERKMSTYKKIRNKLDRQLQQCRAKIDSEFGNRLPQKFAP